MEKRNVGRMEDWKGNLAFSTPPIFHYQVLIAGNEFHAILNRTIFSK
jgi:hypothetical protein